MNIVVAFLAYNDSTAPYLVDFFKSLKPMLKEIDNRITILAGDNSDQGFSLNELQIKEYCQQLPYAYEYLHFESNLGFAAAYNRLIARAKDIGAEYFLMLNPDMIFDEGMLKLLLVKLKLKHDLGSVAPKVYHWNFAEKKKTRVIDSCGIVLKTGLRFSDLGQGQEDQGQYDNQSILGPSGAVALFRMSALDKIMEAGKYFDENFFMYKEDCDLAYRLAQANYGSCLVPEAIAYHDRSLTLKKGLRNRINDWRGRSKWLRSQSFIGQHQLFIKHWSSEGLLSRLYIILEIILYFIFSLLFANFLLKSYRVILRSPKFNK